MEEPNFADWLQGWGTVAGAVFSFLAVLVTGRVLIHELRVRRAERYHNDSAQARLVRVKSVLIDDGTDGISTRIRYRVHNRSDHAVGDVHIRHLSQDGNSFESPDRRVSMESGEERWISITDSRLATPVGETKLVHGMNIPFILVFSDIEGRLWLRREGAYLPERMLKEPLPKPSSIFGLLSESWGIPQRVGHLTRVMNAPRLKIKSRIRG